MLVICEMKKFCYWLHPECCLDHQLCFVLVCFIWFISGQLLILYFDPWATIQILSCKFMKFLKFRQNSDTPLEKYIIIIFALTLYTVYLANNPQDLYLLFCFFNHPVFVNDPQWFYILRSWFSISASMAWGIICSKL